ncbi:MAG: hypothetical protein Q9195_002213 [Heterodermia aff. obscurata]
MVPELRSKLKESSSSSYQVAIVGIETHICVTQTALDLLADGHNVYVLADGVSSCNEGERRVALDRLRQEGATITTSLKRLPVWSKRPRKTPKKLYKLFAKCKRERALERRIVQDRSK